MKTLRAWVLAAVASAASGVAAQTPNFSVLLIPAGMPPISLGRCQNIGSETTVLEQRVVGEGGQETVRKLPGPLRWLDIRCDRPLTASLELQLWRQQVEDGDTTAVPTAEVILQDATGQPIARWILTNVWPQRLVVDLDQSSATESLVLVYESMTRDL